ncbi:MAG: phosphoglycerate dehydrogenase [Desulfobacterales bacterium]|nr:phosphoglycerate dehydrogenase [Desulfobacterales bacterium]
MDKSTVLIEARPFGVFDDAEYDRLKSQDLEIMDMRGSGIEDAKFVKALETADALLCGNDLIINDDLLAKAPNVKVIAKMGAGLDTVDIDSASRHGAVVFHTPGVNNHAVADHAFALILSLARKIVYCDQSLRNRRWEHTKIMGVEIWQKTLGLIGLGAIGRNVALRAKGFQMKVVAYDPYWPEDFAREHDIQRVEVEELLAMSDIVSLHTPLTKENKGMINRRTLGLMKPSALLINTSRGGIIVEADLIDALKNRVIAGAGLDVFEQEPPTDSELFHMDNVVITPHTAAFTHEAMKNMDAGVVDQLIEFFGKNKPRHTVNPEVYGAFKGKFF